VGNGRGGFFFFFYKLVFKKRLGPYRMGTRGTNSLLKVFRRGNRPIIRNATVPMIILGIVRRG